jgi:hypothetical protein
VCECNQAHPRQGSRHQSTCLNPSNVDILPAPEAGGAAGERAVYRVTEAARLIQSVRPDACLAALRSCWANIPSMTVSSSDTSTFSLAHCARSARPRNGCYRPSHRAASKIRGRVLINAQIAAFCSPLASVVQKTAFAQALTDSHAGACCFLAWFLIRKCPLSGKTERSGTCLTN